MAKTWRASQVQFPPGPAAGTQECKGLDSAPAAASQCRFRHYPAVKRPKSSTQMSTQIVRWYDRSTPSRRIPAPAAIYHRPAGNYNFGWCFWLAGP